MQRIVVRTKDDLPQYRTPERVLPPVRKPQLLIRVPQMAGSEARAWEWRLEALRTDCGCSAGAVGLCGFLVLFIAFALMSSPSTAALQSGALVVDGSIFVVGLIVSAAFGKVVGLWIAAARWQQTYLQLQARVRALEA